MQEILSSYRTYLENDKGFSDNTVKRYSDSVEKMFKILRVYSIEQLTPDLINKRWLDHFWNESQIKRPYADKTRVMYLSALKSFLGFLYKHEMITHDIAEKIEMPKTRTLFLEGLSDKEQKTLREYIATKLRTESDMRNAAIIMFMWSTAARVSEALRLRCHPDSYIYFHDSSMISGDFHVEDDRVYVHIMGKGKKDRKIVVPDDALAYLNLYLNERKTKNAVVFQGLNKEESLRRESVVYMLYRYFNACGIKKPEGLCTHVLRHTAINTWIERGIPGERIVTMTGHANVSSLDIYFKRNKKLTNVFAMEGRAVKDVEDPKLRQLEELMRQRHTPKV